jgi:hypothetical protein
MRPLIEPLQGLIGRLFLVKWSICASRLIFSGQHIDDRTLSSTTCNVLHTFLAVVTMSLSMAICSLPTHGDTYTSAQTTEAPLKLFPQRRKTGVRYPLVEQLSVLPGTFFV